MNSSSMPKIAAASFAGAVMEWYDFYVFGTASALVFGKLFFPNADPLTAMTASFATFGVGFLARPLGGIFFGHIGDKVGRKASLLATLIIVGMGTFLIGLLPVYETAGFWAPVMLVVLRLLQGFGIGGEYGGAALMTIEHAPQEKRGFWGSVPQSAASGGILLATAVFALVTRLPQEQLLSWGWRIPFLISAIMLIVGLFIRLQIEETPDFKRSQERIDKPKVPLFALIQQHPRNLLLTIGARVSENVSSNIINTFAIGVLTSCLAVDRGVPLMGMMLASGLGFLACPLFGWLSDRVGHRALYLCGAGFLALAAYPFFMLLETKSAPLIILAIVIVSTFGAVLMFSVQATFFSSLFEPGVRYTGLSMAAQLSAVVGGFTPLIASRLLAEGNGAPWYVAAYMAGVAVLSFICATMASSREPQASSVQASITAASIGKAVK